MRTQMSITSECLQEKIRTQLQRTVIKGATETTTGQLKGNKSMRVEMMSHFSSKNMNKKITRKNQAKNC